MAGAHTTSPALASGIGAWSDDGGLRRLSFDRPCEWAAAPRPDQWREAVDLSFRQADGQPISARWCLFAHISAGCLSDAGSYRPRKRNPRRQTQAGSAPLASCPLPQAVFDRSCASCHSWTGASRCHRLRDPDLGSRAVNDPDRYQCGADRPFRYARPNRARCRCRPLAALTTTERSRRSPTMSPRGSAAPRPVSRQRMLRI